MNRTPEPATVYVSPVKLVPMPEGEGLGPAYQHVARMWSVDSNAFADVYSRLNRPSLRGWLEACALGIGYAVDVSPGERIRAIEAGAVESDAPGPVAGDVKPCRSCHKPITWALTAKGKPAPYDADGRSHFATCPQANAWRRPR